FVLILLLAAAAYVASLRSPAPGVKSLAVLPLKSLALEADKKYLELGIADGIIGKVSAIPGLTVRPTGSVRQYVESRADPLRAGQELKVDAVLDGTLQVAGDRIRVRMNLLRTSNGASLWTHTFDTSLNNVFALEDEIAVEAARQLRFQLDGS